jgi:hypothetical protein
MTPKVYNDNDNDDNSKNVDNDDNHADHAKICDHDDRFVFKLCRSVEIFINRKSCPTDPPTNFGLLGEKQKKWAQQVADICKGDYLTTYTDSYTVLPDNWRTASCKVRPQKKTYSVQIHFI